MTATGGIVPDASVILKWVLGAEDEPGHEAAWELLDGWQSGELELAVPTLWLYEVGNILCLKRPDDAGSILETLRALRLHEHPPTREWVAETVAMARAQRVTFYDAAYLATAKVRGALLITADTKFVRALPEGAPAELLAGIGGAR